MASSGSADKRDAALAEVRAGFKSGDEAAAASAILRLIKCEPQRWRRILLLDDVVPNATNRDWHEQLPLFMSVISRVVQSDEITTDDMKSTAQTLFALLNLGQRFGRISKCLESSQSFLRSKATQTYRLAVWIESQAALLHDSVMAEAIRHGRYDPNTPLQTSISDDETGDSVAPIQLWETQVDVTELTLRYLHWRHANDPFGDIDPEDSPYDAPDFHELVLLGGVWLELTELWADIKFNGWLPVSHGTDIVYLPPDTEDLRRRFISIVRSERFKSQDITNFVNAGQPFSDAPAALQELAHTVTIPPRGQTWDCVMDSERLHTALQHTYLLELVRFYIDHRHYRALVDNLSGGIGASDVSWSEWLAVRNALAVAGGVYAQAIQDRIHDCVEQRERRVVPVAVSQLADLLSSASGIPNERCRAALELMTFTPSNRGLDIYDQPLLPVGDGVVLLVPTLALLGTPIYSLEHFVASYGIGDFAVRGIPFEKSIAASLVSVGIPAKADIWVRLRDGHDMNYDNVVWWQGYLLLIEAKCVKTEFSAAHEFGTWKAIEASIEQLIRRRSSLGEFWQGLRAAAPTLALPHDVPCADHVLCISVTNSMRFSGFDRDGVVCTDDLCLRKYFDPPQTPVYESDGNRTRIVGHAQNRQRDSISPLDLIEYLRAPPQITSLASDVGIRMRRILQLAEETSSIVVPAYTYDGSMESMVEWLNGTE